MEELYPPGSKPHQQQTKVDLPSAVGLKVASNITFRLLILLGVVERVSVIATGFPTRIIREQDTANFFSIASSFLYRPNRTLWIAANK